MKKTTSHVVVLVTAPDVKTARALVHGALKERLAACANLIPKIESHYWWKGKLEKSAEVLILFKTTRTKLKPLKKNLLAHHPYETAEFIVLPIAAGSKRYLDWVSDSVE